MDVINAKSNTYPFVEVVIYSEILRTNCRMNQSSSHLATSHLDTSDGMYDVSTEEITASKDVTCVVTTRASKVKKRMKPLHVEIDSK